MTSAEFRTLTESLGLTAEAAARLLGVQPRTIRRWQAGEWPVPDDAAAVLLALDARIEAAVSGAMQQVADVEAAAGHPPEDVVMVRYLSADDLARYRPDMAELPLSTHAALLDRLRVALSRRGVAVRLVYMVPEVYEAWLTTRRARDSESMRAAWAASLLPH